MLLQQLNALQMQIDNQSTRLGSLVPLGLGTDVIVMVNRWNSADYLRRHFTRMIYDRRYAENVLNEFDDSRLGEVGRGQRSERQNVEFAAAIAAKTIAERVT